jgi:uncharacterized protein
MAGLGMYPSVLLAGRPIFVYTYLYRRRCLCGLIGMSLRTRANLRKHGIDFNTASLVFNDPMQLLTQDREVDGEERWQTLGVAEGVLLLLVAHTFEEDDGEVVRIISARKADAQERRRYEDGL